MFVNDQILNSVCRNVKIAMRTVFTQIRAEPDVGSPLNSDMGAMFSVYGLTTRLRRLT
jgi:hypothetical protein